MSNNTAAAIMLVQLAIITALVLYGSLSNILKHMAMIMYRWSIRHQRRMMNLEIELHQKWTQCQIDDNI